MSSGRTTLHDLAAATGLSVSTVSRALAGSQRISVATRQRVRAEAERQGYEADLAASLLRRSNPRHVGVLCRLDQELHFAYRSELLLQAERAGLRLVVQSVDSGWSLPQALSALRQMRCRALVVIDPGSYEGLDFATVGMPAVVVGQGPGDGATDLVTSDNATGMAHVAAHLASQGLTEIAYLDGPPGCSATRRREVFLKAAAHSGLTVRVVPSGAGTDAGFDAVRDLIDSGAFQSGEQQQDSPRPGEASVPRPTAAGVQALVCYNDQCAQGAVMALVRRGLVVGRDVAVMGCDDTRIARSRAFDLSSINRHTRDVAGCVIDLVLSRMEHPERMAQHLSVATELVVRGSSCLAQPVAGHPQGDRPRA